MAKAVNKAKSTGKKPKRKAIDRLRKLKIVISNPMYLAVLIIAAIVYYYLFYYLITSSNYGLFLVTVPTYLLYALVITSSLLLTVAVSSIHGGIKYTRAVSGSISGSITMLAGGAIASCSCTIPVFVSLLYLLGASVADVTFVTFYISTYQPYIMSVLILANISLIYYYLGKL